MSMGRRWATLWWLPLVLASACGCGSKNAAVVKSETSHVRLLAMLHTKASSKLRRAPRDEQEFKQTLAAMSVAVEPLKVASIDELFTSERDGEPLVVVYGRPPKGSDVVVYEQTGVNGKRLVGYKIGMVEEIDEPTFNDLGLTKR